MSVTITEVVEEGIPYRITEDLEAGVYIKESMQEPALTPVGESDADKIERLATESSDMNLQIIDIWETLYAQGVIQ